MLLFILFLTKLLPYAITLVNGYQKGYRWLTIAAVYLIVLSSFNYYNQALDLRTQLLSAIFAYMLMLHSVNIQSRRRR